MVNGLMIKAAVAHKLQGRREFQGLEISVENRKGGVRKGVDQDGSEWRTKMRVPYGYIRRTKGNDGDHVDCFIGPNEDARFAYIVHIKNPKTDRYDEDKVMLGFDTKEDAEKAFRRHYDTPGEFIMDIATMKMEDFKRKINGDFEKGRRSVRIGGSKAAVLSKQADEIIMEAFCEALLEKSGGAGTYAVTTLLPASTLAIIGSLIGAVSNEEDRGKGALMGAGIGTAMGVAGGLPIGRAISKAMSEGKLRKALESMGVSFGKGVKKELNPFHNLFGRNK